VPEDQYGNPGPGGIYNHWDKMTLDPPVGAVYATIDLLYQPTSWEYIQFLWLANDRSDPFLADEGDFLLEAWLNTGMAFPYIMSTVTWGSPPVPQTMDLIVDSMTTWLLNRRGELVEQTDTFRGGDRIGIMVHAVDSFGSPLSGCQVFVEIYDSLDNLVTSLQEFTDTNGDALTVWRTSKREPPDTYRATVVDVIKGGYTFSPELSITEVFFTVQ
jgi:hypothetical protein